jgi:hypothetical protein
MLAGNVQFLHYTCPQNGHLQQQTHLFEHACIKAQIPIKITH